MYILNGEIKKLSISSSARVGDNYVLYCKEFTDFGPFNIFAAWGIF
jgi:hypothetical protein